METMDPWRRRLPPLLWGAGTLFAAWIAAQVAADRATDAARAALLGYAPTYAQALASLGHAELPERVPGDDPAYMEMIAAERRWESANPRVRDIWTLRRTAEDRVVHVVDAESDYNQNGAFDTAYEHRLPPDAVDANPLSDEAKRAFRGESAVDFRVRRDARGEVVEGWAPIRDDQGRVAAVVGVAFDAAPIELLRAVAQGLAGGLVGAWGLALGLLLRQRSIRAEARQRLAEAAFLQDEAGRARDAATVATQRAAARMRGLLDRLPVPAALRVGTQVWPNPALVRLMGERTETLDGFFRAGWGNAAGAARGFYESDRGAGFPEERVLPLGRDRRPHRWHASLDADHDLWLFTPVEQPEIRLDPQPVAAEAPLAPASAPPEAEPFGGPLTDEVPLHEDPLLADLTRGFVEELPARVAAMTSLAATDPGAAERLAAELASGAAEFGFPVVARAARRVGDALRDPTRPARQRMRLVELTQRVSRLHERLDSEQQAG